VWCAEEAVLSRHSSMAAQEDHELYSLCQMANINGSDDTLHMLNMFPSCFVPSRV
jgi:hypothetical protein